MTGSGNGSSARIDGHLRRGVGVACSMQGSGIAGMDWASAMIKLNEDGSFFLQVGASDLGAGADTVLAQIAAETLGVTLDKIIVTSGDTDFTPFDVGAYASRTTIISGGAVKKTAEKVREHIVNLASKMLERPARELDLPRQPGGHEMRVRQIGDHRRSRYARDLQGEAANH